MVYTLSKEGEGEKGRKILVDVIILASERESSAVATEDKCGKGGKIEKKRRGGKKRKILNRITYRLDEGRSCGD